MKNLLVKDVPFLPPDTQKYEQGFVFLHGRVGNKKPKMMDTLSMFLQKMPILNPVLLL